MPNSIVPRFSTRRSREPINPYVERYHVYRLYGADGALLYVGRSCQPLGRLRAHHDKAPWAGKVVAMEGHGPYTWDEAVRRERQEILRLRPMHNIDGVTRNTGRNFDDMVAAS